MSLSGLSGLSGLRAIVNSGNSLVIDAFNTGAAPSYRPAGVANYSDTASVLGGTRDIAISVISGSLGSFIGVTTGIFSIQIFGSATNLSHSCRFRYDGVADNPGGSPDTSTFLVNASAYIAVRAVVAGRSGLLAPSSIQITLYDFDSNSSLSQSVLGSGVANFDFLFSSFSGIDFSSIRAIEVLIANTNGSSNTSAFNLDSISFI